MFNCLEQSQFPKKHAVCKTAGSRVVIVHKYNVLAVLMFFLQLYIFKPTGQSPVPKPAPVIPPPLYFILNAEQWDSFEMLEDCQSGWSKLPSLGSSSLSVTLSPDSVQLPVVSIMKEVVVGGSGGAGDGQRRNV